MTFLDESFLAFFGPIWTSSFVQYLTGILWGRTSFFLWSVILGQFGLVLYLFVLVEDAWDFPGCGTKAKNQQIFRSLQCGVRYLCAVALFQQLIEIC